MRLLLLAALTSVLLSPLPTESYNILHPKEVRVTTFGIAESRNHLGFQSITDGEITSSSEPRERKTQESTRSGILTDKVLGAESTAFTRTYDSLTADQCKFFKSARGRERAYPYVLKSWFNGATVQFEPRLGQVTPCVPMGENINGLLLPGLLTKLPFERLMPKADIEVGDQWPIETMTIWQLIRFGADLAWTAPEMELEQAQMLAVVNNDDFVTTNGEVGATLVSLTNGLATITLAIEMVEVRDVTAAMNLLTEDYLLSNPDYVPPITLMQFQSEYNGEATLVWNMNDGHLVSLELELDFIETETLNIEYKFGSVGSVLIGLIEELNGRKTEQTTTFEGQLDAAFGCQVTWE